MSIGTTVCPLIIGVALLRHVTIPVAKKPSGFAKYVQRFVLGVGLIWIGLETKGDIPLYMSVILAIGGFLLTLVNGEHLFTDDTVKH